MRTFSEMRADRCLGNRTGWASTEILVGEGIWGKGVWESELQITSNLETC